MSILDLMLDPLGLTPALGSPYSGQAPQTPDYFPALRTYSVRPGLVLCAPLGPRLTSYDPDFILCTN